MDNQKPLNEDENDEAQLITDKDLLAAAGVVRETTEGAYPPGVPDEQQRDDLEKWRLAIQLDAEDLSLDKESGAALLVLYAGLYSRDPETLADITRLPLDFVRTAAERYIEQGFWLDDMSVRMDGFTSDDAGERRINTVMAAFSGLDHVVIGSEPYRLYTRFTDAGPVYRSELITPASEQ